MDEINKLIKELEDDLASQTDFNERSVNLSDVKQWALYVLEAVEKDLQTPTVTPKADNEDS